jgi:hypothetical protein
MKSEYTNIIVDGIKIPFLKYKDGVEYETLQNQFDSNVNAMFDMQNLIEETKKTLENQKMHLELLKISSQNLDLKINEHRDKMIIDDSMPKFTICFYRIADFQHAPNEKYVIYSANEDLVGIIANKFKSELGYNYCIIKVKHYNEHRQYHI